MSAKDRPRSGRGDWVALADGVRVSRTWMTRHTPCLLAAWCDATSAAERRAVGVRILRIASALESKIDDRGWEPSHRTWGVLAGLIDPRLVSGPDWPPLASALDRAAAAGYDVASRLPALARAAPLPARHPARELVWRLLDDCPAAVPPTPRSRPPPADAPWRVSTAGPSLHRLPPVPRNAGPAAKRRPHPPHRRRRRPGMTPDVTTDPLSYAAALLDAVGADRAQVPAEIALSCLYAAELLELAGARPAPRELVDGDVRITLRVAMAALADLDEDTFLQPAVLDAARAARAARHALRRMG